jgi:hypothetical protein
MYLFAESHDCEGLIPALKTNCGDETFDVDVDVIGTTTAARAGALGAGPAAFACPTSLDSFACAAGMATV